MTEDPYGVAQRDIPKVLEAFVLYLFALEDLTKALLPSAADEDMAREVAEQIAPVEGGELPSPLFPFLVILVWGKKIVFG